MRDIVFVSLEDWDDIWRRNQFICERIVERHPTARILFVSPPHNVLRSLVRGEIRAFLGQPANRVHPLPNITTVAPWQVLPNRYRWCRRFNEWLMRVHVRCAARRLKLNPPLLWLNPHDAVHLVGHMDEAVVIYDVTDDWSELKQPPAKKRLMVEQDTQLCRLASAVIVCSEGLFHRKRPLAANVHLVPNGVDATHYAKVLEAHEASTEAADWPKPVMAYTGTLHGERLNIELVRQIASIQGVGSLVMIGPNHLSSAEIERLRLPNIFLLGPVPYERLPIYMSSFDVCIVPHLVTPFTESLNPIKLWEYLATGKPIIATPVAGFRDFPQFVYLAADVSEFARALPMALQENRAHSERRRTEAARHSWDVRVATIEEIVSQCEARRGLAKTGKI